MDIKKIARIAGVSPATVSKVVNHKDSAISQETRDRVARIVKQYHYVPYSSAITRQNARRVIAVVLREPVSYDSVLDGILRTAQANEYVPLVLDSYSSAEMEEQNIDSILESGCAGIIWEPVAESSRILEKKIEDSQVPHLLIGMYGGSDSFVQPYYKAAHHMTQEMIIRGHRDIGCLLSQSRRTEEFLQGYKDCLLESDISLRDDLVFYDVGANIASMISERRMTGIISSHFRDAIRFSQLMGKLHHHIPADISLISLRSEGTDAQEGNCDTSISTCPVRTAEFGSFLCERLLSSIEGRNSRESYAPHYELENTSTVSAPIERGPEKVVVVGSINCDSYMLVPRLPKAGTSVSALTTQSFPGGKATNQAVGIAKLGFHAAVIGNVGSDFESDDFYRVFDRWGIDDSSVKRIGETETGKALIFASPQGETAISLIPGANSQLTPDDIRSRAAAFDGARYCLVQTEVPVDAVIEACRIARERDIKTVLKPSSCGELPAELLRFVDCVIPNETELDEICPSVEGGLDEKASWLLGQGPELVIVTLANRGCYLCSRETRSFFPPSAFVAVDDAGAGDAFISAFVASRMFGNSLERSARIANYAAGFSVTRHGVISSLIDKFSLEMALESEDVGA